jgi:hypothetical protein
VFDHIGIGVSNLDAARPSSSALAPLGVDCPMDVSRAVGLGRGQSPRFGSAPQMTAPCHSNRVRSRGIEAGRRVLSCLPRSRRKDNGLPGGGSPTVTTMRPLSWAGWSQCRGVCHRRKPSVPERAKTCVPLHPPMDAGAQHSREPHRHNSRRSRASNRVTLGEPRQAAGSAANDCGSRRGSLGRHGWYEAALSLANVRERRMW